MATTISTLADKVQNRLNTLQRQRYLWRQFIGCDMLLESVCFFTRLFSTWQWRESSRFRDEMFLLVTVWANQFKVIWGWITWIVILMMNLQNTGAFVVSASVARVVKMLSGPYPLPSQSAARPRRYSFSACIYPLTLPIAVTRISADFLRQKFSACFTVPIALYNLKWKSLPRIIELFESCHPLFTNHWKKILGTAIFAAIFRLARTSFFGYYERLSTSYADKLSWLHGPSYHANLCFNQTYSYGA